jgi:16S rRNA (adenine1518-N6/adenine1519-N6)-dimethyltransferase
MLPDLTQPRQVRDLLSRHGVWLAKAMGQHLLVDRDVLDRIVAAAALTPETEVLEVGPGAGVLTRELSRAAKRVVAVELDRRMVGVLRETVAAPNVDVVQADALEIEPSQLFAGAPYKLVANLPYNVATPLIRRLLHSRLESRPEEMVVMVQREVGLRLAAQPNDMSYLTVETQVAADAEVVLHVPPAAFFPPPEVASVVVRLRPLAAPRVPLLPNERRYFQTVEAGFKQRRKQLHNALGALGVGTDRIRQALSDAGIDPQRRAETLTLPEWSRLSAALWD